MTEGTAQTEKPKRTADEIKAAKLDTARKAVSVAVKAHERATTEARDISLRAAASATRVQATTSRVQAATDAYKLAYFMVNGAQPPADDETMQSAQVGGSKGTGTDEPAGDTDHETGDEGTAERPADPFADDE